MAEEKKKPTIDERLEALTMNVELMGRNQESLLREVRDLFLKAGENINALARIAQTHEDRLERLEGRG